MKTLLILLLFVATANAQEHITLNITQDAKLLFVGDDKGNEAGTLNVTVSSEWQGKNLGGYYFFIRPEAELAKLATDYYRYSVNVGWTFNEWIDKIDFTASVGYGVIDYNGARTSFGGNLQTSYEIFDGVKFVLDLEGTERRDLLEYGERIRISGKFGFKFNLK